MKITKDFKLYIDHLDELSKRLPIEQRKKLENILLGMLIAMKRDSKLGEILFDWEK